MSLNGTSIDSILQKYLPHNELTEIQRILYGNHNIVRYLGTENLNKYDVEKYHFGAESQNPRIIKVAAIQHSVDLPTNEPIWKQKNELYAKIEGMVEKASSLGANIICLQECWNMPFGFCTREKMPWCEFAENCENGSTTHFVRQLAKRCNVVIISPILERDEDHGDVLWNTAVVVSERGVVLGKQRKNHIPLNGESEYYSHGTNGHQVFDTTYGKIGVLICFDRHHPQSWMMYARNGAEIVFNPATTTVNEHWWSIEARCAAFAHNYYTVAINRVGTEVFHLNSGDSKVFGPCFGSTYITAPDGSRTKSLSRHRDGILFAELDLRLCERIKKDLTSLNT